MDPNLIRYIGELFVQLRSTQEQYQDHLKQKDLLIEKLKSDVFELSKRLGDLEKK